MGKKRQVWKKRREAWKETGVPVLVYDLPLHFEWWAEKADWPWGHEAHWGSVFLAAAADRRYADAEDAFFICFRDKETETESQRQDRNEAFKRMPLLNRSSYEDLRQLAKTYNQQLPEFDSLSLQVRDFILFGDEVGC